MMIETEATPNPATLKFLPGRQVMVSGTRDFPTPESAEVSPLAEALFDLGDVTGVLFGQDFVAVTAAPGVSWPELKGDVVTIILEHFVTEQPLFRGGDAGRTAHRPPSSIGCAPSERVWRPRGRLLPFAHASACRRRAVTRIRSFRRRTSQLE